MKSSGDAGTIAALQRAYVDTLKARGYIRSAAVEAAFRAVPRHLFLPGVPPGEAYAVRHIVTRRAADGTPLSASSGPRGMAIMLEALDLKPGHRVLEIGAGTGYNAALIAHIVGEHGRVISLDIDADIIEQARANLLRAGYSYAKTVRRDGSSGYPDDAPYDRIIFTVSVPDLAPDLLKQIAPDGRLMIALWLGGMDFTVVFQPADGGLESLAVLSHSFIAARGETAGPQGDVQLGPNVGLCLKSADRTRVAIERVYALLSRSSRELSARIETTLDEVNQGLVPWLALREPRFIMLIAENEWMAHADAPELFRWPDDSLSTWGLLEEDRVCILMSSFEPGASRFELTVRSWGADEALARQLTAQIDAWDVAGRPALKDLRIRAHPIGARVAPRSNETILDKRGIRFALAFQRE